MVKEAGCSHGDTCGAPSDLVPVASEDGSVASGCVRGLEGSHWGHMDDDGAWEMLRGEEIAKDR